MRRMYSENQLESIIKEQVEGGQLSNAKPIYCHPISFVYSPTSCRITCLIFNNDATAFTATTFADWLNALYLKIGTVRIMCSGAFIANENSTSLTIASYMGTGSSGYYLMGVDINGIYNAVYRYTSKDDFISKLVEFADAVNKIN